MSIFQKVKKNVGSLMLIIVFSKLIGMFRDVVLANCFGTSNVSDAYLIYFCTYIDFLFYRTFFINSLYSNV